MKKLLSLLLVGVMVFSLVACGTKENNDETGKEKGTTTIYAKTKEKVSIHINKNSSVISVPLYASSPGKYVIEPIVVKNGDSYQLSNSVKVKITDINNNKIASEVLPTPGGPTKHSIACGVFCVIIHTAKYSNILSFTLSKPK